MDFRKLMQPVAIIIDTRRCDCLLGPLQLEMNYVVVLHRWNCYLRYEFENECQRCACLCIFVVR